MATRPNPTQHVMGDERELREYVRVRLPDGKALDREDLALAFEESSQRSIYRAVRKAALRWVLENMPDRFIVRPGFAEELAAYAEGRGELPDDAKAITADDQNARRFKRAVNPGAVVVVGRGVSVRMGPGGEEVPAAPRSSGEELKADEEGRYPGQEPRGRFARAGAEGFEPDPR